MIKNRPYPSSVRWFRRPPRLHHYGDCHRCGHDRREHRDGSFGLDRCGECAYEQQHAEAGAPGVLCDEVAPAAPASAWRQVPVGRAEIPYPRPMTARRLEFICLQPQEVMCAVIAAALRGMRCDIDMAWIDAITDGEWTTEQRADVAALLAVEQRLPSSGERRKPTGTGIDLDLSRDDEFGLLVRLAPYSIHSEAWIGGDEVFSSSDTGDHAWFALTPKEASDVAARLADAGYAFEEVLAFRK